MQLIMESWRQYLSEVSRYEIETGKKSYAADEIKQFISTEEPVTHAFTMTDVEKVGINPKTKYNTPAGVYFYPLNQEYYEMLIKDKLPFRSDALYSGVVKLNDSIHHLGLSSGANWLVFIKSGENNQTKTAARNVADKLTQMIINPTTRKKFDFSDEIARDLEQGKVTLQHLVSTKGSGDGRWVGGLHWDFNTDAQIFDLTAYLVQNLTGRRRTIAWNSLLRELGFIGIYDAGNGVVHPQEPTQVVALTPQAYKLAAFYPTQDLRRSHVWRDKAQMLQRALNSDSAALLGLLSNNGNEEVRANVANNPNTSADILEKLSQDKEWGVRQKVALNPSTSDEVREKLSQDRHSNVRGQVAASSDTPAWLLGQMTKWVIDQDPPPTGWVTTLIFVAKNPNTPTTVLRLLLNELGMKRLTSDVEEALYIVRTALEDRREEAARAASHRASALASWHAREKAREQEAQGKEGQ